MAKQKPRHVALILIFCGFIGLFGLLYILLPRTDFSESEKRVLAGFPALSPAAVFDGSFEKGFEDWLNDHVPFRTGLVGLNAAYELASGRNGLNGVILGRDARLFAAPEPFDAEAIRRKCARVNAFAETSGRPTSVLLIPESGYAQADALPLLHGKYKDEALAACMRESLDGAIDFLWPADRFSGADAGALYYRTDHHLTSRGAHEAWALYAESLGIVPAPEEAYGIELYADFYGSMYAKSGLWAVPPDSVELWRNPALDPISVSFDDRDSTDSPFFPEHLQEMDKYPVFLDGNHALVTLERPDVEGENLLIIRDSFGHCFAPFAAEGFHRIVLVDLRYYRLPVSALVEEQEIDRVLVLYGADTFLTDTNLAWLK